MKERPLYTPFFFLMVAVLASYPAWGQESLEELKPIYSQRTRQVYEGLKLRSSLPSIDFASVKWEYGDAGSVPLPSELPAKNNGVFYIRDVRTSSTLSSPPLVGFFSEPVVRLVTGEGVLGKEECVKTATDFASANFAWFFEQNVPVPRIEGPNVVGDYNITWQKYREDELPDTHVWIDVRSFDGKIVGFSASRFSGSWEHKITPTQAKEKAIGYFSEQKKFSNVQINNWSVTGGNGKRWYDIWLRATDTKTNTEFATYVGVDANDGTVLAGQHGWSAVGNEDDTPEPTNDTLPVWTKAGLVFASNRPLAGRPNWLKYPAQLFVRPADGLLSYLTCDLAPGRFEEIGGNSYSNWINMEWRGWTYGLNLDTGGHSVLTNPRRYIPHSTITSTGMWIVGYGATAKGAPPSNSVLFTHGRLKKARANVQHSVVSPDGKWLYFASVQYVNFKPKESIYRVPVKSLQKRVPLELPPNDIQLLAEKVPAEVVRLSIAKDGANLVAQTTNGVFTIGTSKKTLRKISFGSLKDKELNRVAITDVQDAWAGPGSDEVTFSGKTKSNNVVRRRIYSCRLNGTLLKSWTPADSLPVRSYQFQSSHKSADDWNKNAVLQEIAWELKETNS